MSQVFDRVSIILVEPSHPGNIGAAARALKTMGLSRLKVVNPKRFPDPQAEWRAAGAQDVLEAALICESVDEAIADCQWVVGTSTRNRRIPWPVLSAEEVAAQLHTEVDRDIAIVFGRETSGLTNDELQKCHCHLQIPASPDYPSLNLAMAVQVVCYELFKQTGAVEVQSQDWDRPLATMAQVEGLLEHLEAVLVSSAFLDATNPGQTMTRLRRLFTRLRPDATEVQILRGVLAHLDKG